MTFALGTLRGVLDVPVVDDRAVVGAHPDDARAGNQVGEQLVVPGAVIEEAVSAHRDHLRDEPVRGHGLADAGSPGDHDRRVRQRAIERVEVLHLAGDRLDEQRDPARAATRRADQREAVGGVLDADPQGSVRDVGAEGQRREPESLLQAVAPIERSSARRARDGLLRAVGGRGERVLVGARPGSAQREVHAHVDEVRERVLRHLLGEGAVRLRLGAGVRVAAALAGFALDLAHRLVMQPLGLVGDRDAVQAVQMHREGVGQRLVHQLGHPERARHRRRAGEVEDLDEVLLDLGVIAVAAEVQRAAGDEVAQRERGALGVLALDRIVEARQHRGLAVERLGAIPADRGRVQPRADVAQHGRSVEDAAGDAVACEMPDQLERAHLGEPHELVMVTQPACRAPARRPVAGASPGRARPRHTGRQSFAPRPFAVVLGLVAHDDVDALARCEVGIDGAATHALEQHLVQPPACALHAVEVRRGGSADRAGTKAVDLLDLLVDEREVRFGLDAVALDDELQRLAALLERRDVAEVQERRDTLVGGQRLQVARVARDDVRERPVLEHDRPVGPEPADRQQRPRGQRLDRLAFAPASSWP